MRLRSSQHNKPKIQVYGPGFPLARERTERIAASASDLLLLLHVAHRSLGPHAAAAAREGVSAVDLPIASDRTAREGLPVVGPVTERIAVPWRLWRDRRELQFLPDRARALHELAPRQSERRRRVLE